jgi:hypothetical protein
MNTKIGKGIIAAIAAADPAFHHLKAFDLSPHQEKLTMNAKAFRRSRCYMWYSGVMQIFQ